MVLIRGRALLIGSVKQCQPTFFLGEWNLRYQPPLPLLFVGFSVSK